MTHLNFSRPANDWVGDTFEEDNENMAALALQTSASDDDDEEEVVPVEEVVAGDAPVIPLVEEEKEEDEEGGDDDLKRLAKMEADLLKSDDFRGIGDLLDEEDSM